MDVDKISLEMFADIISIDQIHILSSFSFIYLCVAFYTLQWRRLNSAQKGFWVMKGVKHVLKSANRTKIVVTSGSVCVMQSVASAV